MSKNQDFYNYLAEFCKWPDDGLHDRNWLPLIKYEIYMLCLYKEVYILLTIHNRMTSTKIENYSIKYGSWFKIIYQ